MKRTELHSGAQKERPWPGLLYRGAFQWGGGREGAEFSLGRHMRAAQVPDGSAGAASLHPARCGRLELSVLHSFCTRPPELRCPYSPIAPGTVVWSAGGKASACSTLSANETRGSTKEKKKKRFKFILLPNFYFYFPGLVNGLCQWQN